MRHIIDELYDTMGEEISLLSRLKNAAHLFFCADCNRSARKLNAAKAALGGFFPDAPSFEDAVMSRIENLPDIQAREPAHEVSLRGWIITGAVMLISLITVFFNMDFENVARRAGGSFLIPVGLTIGLALTGYGAIFISAHLKELSEHFGLR